MSFFCSTPLNNFLSQSKSQAQVLTVVHKALYDLSCLPGPVLLSDCLLFLSSLITPLQPHEFSLLFLEPQQTHSCLRTFAFALSSARFTLK